MAEMLLINPRRRRASPKRRKSTAKRRRRNPIGALALRGRRSTMRVSGLARRHRRRRNPIGTIGRRIRRRRNPISLGGKLNTNRLLAMFKDAAIGGAGAIVMDVIQGQLNGFLPATFQTSKTTVGVGDAVKAALTAILGTVGAKATKGLSLKMAQGALAVQAYEILSSFMPPTMTVGYGSPARIVQGSNRVGPTRGGMLQGVGAYQRPGGRTPLLNGLGAYTHGGKSPLLNGMGRMSNAQAREGVSTFR